MQRLIGGSLQWSFPHGKSQTECSIFSNFPYPATLLFWLCKKKVEMNGLKESCLDMLWIQTWIMQQMQIFYLSCWSNWPDPSHLLSVSLSWHGVNFSTSHCIKSASALHKVPLLRYQCSSWFPYSKIVSSSTGAWTFVKSLAPYRTTGDETICEQFSKDDGFCVGRCTQQHVTG